jgi:hypothetical protein
MLGGPASSVFNRGSRRQCRPERDCFRSCSYAGQPVLNIRCICQEPETFRRAGTRSCCSAYNRSACAESCVEPQIRRSGAIADAACRSSYDDCTVRPKGRVKPSQTSVDAKMGLAARLGMTETPGKALFLEETGHSSISSAASTSRGRSSSSSTSACSRRPRSPTAKPALCRTSACPIAASSSSARLSHSQP